MSRQIVVFEDEGFRRLLPLTYTRPPCRLRCGIGTLCQKIARAYPDAGMTMHTREGLAPVVRDELPSMTVNSFGASGALLLNGRVIADADLARRIPLDGPEKAYLCGDEVVAVRADGARWAALVELLKQGPLPNHWADDFPKESIDAAIVVYPWDLIAHNPAQIKADFAALKPARRVAGRVHASAVLDHEDQIIIAEDATIEPGAILTAEEGPIYVAPGATVMAGAVVQGPVSIGAHSTVKILAKIYEGTSFGAYCKVGGEVEECIFQGYSNKQHDGFVGHSFFGEWINLGADTNNSDLKNNYGNVRVVIDGETIDSGSKFVGSTVGDHSKFGINTMLNTGTVVGLGCNVYGAGFPPKEIPSFCWGGGDGFVVHELDKFLATAETVMGRRKRSLSPAMRTLLSAVFEETSARRRAVCGDR